jgi:multicomponent Na+:H+ antiporter subunit G
METIFQLIAILAAVVGTLFSVVGVVGFIRLPDVYTRLHATGKVGVFGVVLLLFAAVVGQPLGWGRGLVLISFLMITGPATAHALGSAAHRIGLPRKGAVRDDLVHTSKSNS